MTLIYAIIGNLINQMLVNGSLTEAIHTFNDKLLHSSLVQHTKPFRTIGHSRHGCQSIAERN